MFCGVPHLDAAMYSYAWVKTQATEVSRSITHGRASHRVHVQGWLSQRSMTERAIVGK